MVATILSSKEFNKALGKAKKSCTAWAGIYY